MFKYAMPKENKEMRLSIEEFIEKYNNDEAVLVDIRMPFELKVWNLPFAIHIPADELEKRIEELPKDKIIVTACPFQNRSPFAAMYLKEKGFNAKYLEKGLIALMDTLKGGEAKKLKID
ncbi:rhodanese-like domain-containing protein [Caminibacter pacificus]|uniref:Rhodanese-like domain-containing protein n=1 Tax=Caminibacter pacificus TaxID=1424653 RepID=A0AAJ4RD82_9BACT|nr:rhodanese-like domain-containing protein [Caminibacter pacificus]QCI28566.1 rhodanese-like domain-containing protein [Caminibacter pacificus]ROR40707.1 rhodanese-related sulfurtransferase [Caminibacter pacificus]